VSYIILTLVFIGGAFIGSIGTLTLSDSCHELVAIEKARDAKEQEREAKLKQFFGESSPEKPEFKDRGL